MKKILFTLVFSAACIGASAQTYAIDAMTFGENEYAGTARSISMGNAMTAIGSDLGSITINPAGSAVASYSQITFTPALNISTNTAVSSSASVPGFDQSTYNTKVRMSVPNFGFTFYFPSSSKSGIKGLTLAFVSTGTNLYLNSPSARGINSKTSVAGAIADGAYGIPSEGSGSSAGLGDLYAYDSFSVSDWDKVSAWKSGMISNFGGFKDQYVGATQKVIQRPGEGNYCSVAGDLDQMYSGLTYGDKRSFDFNVSFNINDVLYLGANLGLSAIRYRQMQSVTEVAINPLDFAIDFGTSGSTCFSDLKFSTDFNTSASGVYGKFGFIFTPGKHFRLGAAIQTPTAFLFNETFEVSSACNYTDDKFSGYSTSSTQTYSYRLRSPWSVNGGMAVVAFDRLVVSADYEMTDFKAMKLMTSSRNEADTEYEFGYDNSYIKDCYGASHALRAGVEFRATDAIAVRAGYNFKTKGEFWYDDDNNRQRITNLNHSASFGLGYCSEGSFFADLATRALIYRNEYIRPYSDYDRTSQSPEILNRRTLWEVLLTIGFRF